MNLVWAMGNGFTWTNFHEEFKSAIGLFYDASFEI
jgi:hypothetical protein